MPEERQRLTGNVEKILQKGAYRRDTLLREVRKAVSQYTRVRPAARDVVSGEKQQILEKTAGTV